MVVMYRPIDILHERHPCPYRPARSVCHAFINTLASNENTSMDTTGKYTCVVPVE